MALTTGAIDSFSKQNIYDLAGNLRERTLERPAETTTWPTVTRGGMYWSHTEMDWCAAQRGPNGVESESTFDFGFRTALYRDEGTGSESAAKAPTYVPQGYTHVSGTTMENGYVIKDKTGNEYVWVEVPRTETVYETAGLQITEFTDEEYGKIETDLQTYTTVYRNGTTYVDEWSSEAATGLTQEEYNTQKKKMLKSIYKNGGFYVGRYETGIDYSQGPRTSAGDTTQTPIIKPNAYPYNYVTNAQAQTLSSGFATQGYTSSLMFGVQWDLVLKYLETKGTVQSELIENSTNWGNYKDNLYNITNTNAKYSINWGQTYFQAPYNKTEAAQVLLTTGASEAFSKQNIYDLAGNAMDWTLEYTNKLDAPCVPRGSSAEWGDVWMQAVNRGYNPAHSAYYATSFRVCLYKDEGTGADEVLAEPTYIPAGYTHVPGTTMENGYVVKDAKGNEYVWVEVPKTISVYQSAGLNITKFTDGELEMIEQDLHTYTTVYRNGTTYVDEWSSQEATGLTEEEYNVQKDKMLKSIYINGGFYVGRYETGIEENYRDYDTDYSAVYPITQTPVIKQNAYPYNWVRSNQAQTLASSFASEGYTSSLMFGVQWDLVLKYIETKGTTQEEITTNATAWGNYLDNLLYVSNPNAKYLTYGGIWTSGPYQKVADTPAWLTTGASSTFSKQNIYDLAGNLWDWTLEAHSDLNSVAFRGGNCWYSANPSGNAWANSRATIAAYCEDGIGFRVALYKDEGTGIGSTMNQNGVIADVVDPVWKVGNIQIENGNANVELLATDKYFKDSEIEIDQIKLLVEGVDVETQETTITKSLSGPTEVTETRNGKKVVYAHKYILTISNLEESVRQNGKWYREWSGPMSIQVPGETIIDQYGNTSKERTIPLGTVDTIKPEFTYVYSDSDIDYETKKVKVVFSVADKYYEQTNPDLTIDDLTIFVDGEAPGEKVTKEITNITPITEKRLVDGEEKEVLIGKTYTLELSNLEQSPNDGWDYSGIVTIVVSAGKVADTMGNTNDATTITIGADIVGQLPSTDYTTPYMPDGYTYVEGALNSGLVIADSYGNEFVWVEVPKTPTVYKTAGLNVVQFTDADFDKIEEDLHDYTMAYRKDSAGVETTYLDEWYSEEATGLTQEEYNTQKEKMLKSIYKNGGFYVGRYETGIDYSKEPRTSAGNTTQAPIIQQNAYPYNYVTVSQAQKLSSGFASTGYTSSLMFGVQWDLIMKYLETKGVTQDELIADSTALGSYSNSTYSITNTNAKYTTDAGVTWNNAPYNRIGDGVESCAILSTGASDTFSKQNIYDLAGNGWEWTLEYSNVPDSPNARRGGEYHYTGAINPVNTRAVNTIYELWASRCFRTALYKDEGTGEIQVTDETMPYLPEGYTYIDGTLDTGVVIQDSNGNEYVWVEVPKSASVYKTAGLNVTSFTDADYAKIETDLKTYTGGYGGATTDGWYSTDATGLTEYEYNLQKKKMLKSIYKNGGFYVGRYETGIDYSQGPRTSAGDTTQTPIIKQNAYPYNYVTTAQAQTLSETFSTTGYTSSLMFGVQWDLILKYMETKGATTNELIANSTSWGNYYNNTYTITNTSAKCNAYPAPTTEWISITSSYTKITEERRILTTGASDTFSKQNIYDLAGNMWEWTLQNKFVARGGEFGWGGENSACSHGGGEGNVLSSNGFRTALYRDEGTGAYSTSEEPTYIPEGYTHVAGTTMSNGYVVEDSKGNEFVWVEVPQTATVYPTAGLDIISFTDADYAKIETDLHTYTTVYRNGTSFVDEWSTEEATGLTQQEYNTQKKKMLKSIYKNGGFYVGRYETGIADSYRTSGEDALQTPVIKQNAYPYNYVTTAQSQVLASGFATQGYSSSLMFGVQWDLVMKYLQTSNAATVADLTTDSTEWGNYVNNEYTITNEYAEYATLDWDTSLVNDYESTIPYSKSSGECTILTTGADSSFQKMGIYDLAGNMSEWTLEYTSDASVPCALRGGSCSLYGYNFPASFHDFFGANIPYPRIGFRVSLYRDEGTGSESAAKAPTYVPEGYTHLAGTTMENGYVIKDKNGNEYVWVEVPRTEEVYGTAGLQITAFTDSEYNLIENDLHTYTTFYRVDGVYADEWTSEAVTGLTQEEYNTQKKKMLKSIYKNGGFYVGRYETGIDYSQGPRTSAGDTTQKPIIKPNAYPYNFVTNAQSQELSETFATQGYTSSMMFGVQWDLIMKYLETKGATQDELMADSRAWGNYFNSTYNITNTSAKYNEWGLGWQNGPYGEKTAGTNVLLSTGADSQFSKQGIYDLAGNIREHTLEELTEVNSIPCVLRGGLYWTDDTWLYRSAGGRGLNGRIDESSTDQGFRVSLYRDEGTGADEVLEEPTYIPAGYTHVEGTTMENGYVVKDAQGNEFVWVEVPKTIAVYQSAGLSVTSFTDSELELIEEDLHTYTSVYRNGTAYVDEWFSEEATGLTEKQYKNQKDKMLKSIYINGGFYVGRYETGIEDSYRTSGEDALQTPAIKQNAYPYNYVSTSQAQTLSESFATQGYTSSLMFGVQWDLVMKYLQTSNAATVEDLTTNSTGWGNYADNEYTITNEDAEYATLDLDSYLFNDYESTIPYSKSSDEVTILTTGADSSFQKMGIYDLAGNMSEMTLEYSSFAGLPCASRGGVCNIAGYLPAGVRLFGEDSYADPTYGFRTALYKDEGTGIGTEESVIVDVVDPVWKVENIEVENGNAKIELLATDKFLKDSKIEIDQIKLLVDGVDVETQETSVIKTLSEPTEVIEIRSGKKVVCAHKYILTIANLEESIRQNGKWYREWSGPMSVQVPGGTIIDQSGNTSKELLISLGTVDTIKPEFTYEYSEGDIDYETKKVQIVFSVTDKYYAETNQDLTINDLTIFVDGEAPGENVTKEITNVTPITEKRTVNGEEKDVVIGKTYTLELSNLEQDPNDGWDYSGIVTIVVSAGKVADDMGNTNDATTITVGVNIPGELPSTEYTMPYMPEGYTYVTGALNSGIVIKDSQGNEFVWVEVPRTSTVYQTAGLNIVTFTDTELDKIEADLKSYTSVYRNGTTYVDEWSSQEATGLTQEQYNVQKDKMLKSIYKNGGFYVGRYETGIDYDEGARTAGGDTTQTPVIKQNAYPYTYVTSVQAQELSSGFASDGYSSSLMFGVQRDLILKYFETKGIPQSDLTTNTVNLGNFNDNLWNVTNPDAKWGVCDEGGELTIWTSGAYKKEEAENVGLSTGAINDFKLQNIYDYYGNMYEWTLEYSNDPSNPSVILGGGYANFGTPGVDWSTRYANPVGDYSSGYGFRTVLYRDEGTQELPTTEKTKPYIPEGYAYVEGTLDSGLVIQDSQGNQFVWVEVPKTTDVYKTAGVTIIEFTDDDYEKIEDDLHEYTTVYRNGTSNVDEWSSEAATGLTQEEYNTQKKKMLKSIYKNGGFYVGRYETGIASSYRDYGADYGTEHPITEVPVIKANAYPYNWVTNAQAQTLSTGFASSGYTSSLMFGVQWDLVMKYLQTSNAASVDDLTTNSITWGNYANNVYTITNEYAEYATLDLDTFLVNDYEATIPYSKSSGEATLLTTGADSSFGKMGIYDLAGNMAEWTLEHTSNERGPCVLRGGFSDGDGREYPASDRDFSGETFSCPVYGFRVALYKDEGTGADNLMTEDGMIVDVVDPVWIVANKETSTDANGVTTAIIELVATDKFFKSSTLTLDQIQVLVGGIDKAADLKAKDGITLSEPVLVKLDENGQYVQTTTKEEAIGQKYIFTLSKFEETVAEFSSAITKYENEQEGGRLYREFSGDVEILVPAGIIEDTSGNTSKELPIDLGVIDTLNPEIIYRYHSTDINKTLKSVEVVFAVTDKYYDETIADIDVEDLDIIIGEYGPGKLEDIEWWTETDGEDSTKPRREFTDITPLYATVDGEEDVLIGKQYTLLLSNLDQNDGDKYSGNVTISIPDESAFDKSENGNISDTITIGIDLPEESGSAVIVDVVNPVWKVENKVVSTDPTTGITSVTMDLIAYDKYFKDSTLNKNQIEVLVSGENKASELGTSLTGPTAVTNGEKYTFTITGFEETYEEFLEERAKYAEDPTTGRLYREFSGDVEIKIASGTIEDLNGNFSVASPIDIGTIDTLKPEVVKVSGTTSVGDKSHTVVFDITDKFIASSAINGEAIGEDGSIDLTKVDTSKIHVLVDGVEAESIDKEITNIQILTATVGTDTNHLVGYRYTLKLSDFEQGERQDGKSFLEWSGNVAIKVDTDTAKDESGTGNAETTLASDFVDFIKPEIERVSATNNTATKTQTIEFAVTDKHFNTTNELTENEIIVKVNGEIAPSVAKPTTVAEQQANKELIWKKLTKEEIKATVNGVPNTVIGYTYTLELSNFEQTEKQAGKSFIEWSGNISIEVVAGAVTDKGATGNGTSLNENILTPINGTFADFIQPKVERVSSEKGTNNETIVFTVIDKYLDTTDPLQDTEINVFVDGEQADNISKSLTSSEIKATVNEVENTVVGYTYTLVLSDFEKSRNAKEYKDWSGTVSIELLANAVKDTSLNTLATDATARTVKGDFVDFIKPDLKYTHQSTDIQTGNKKYVMTFDITDKYYNSGVLTTDDILNGNIEILMQNGQRDASGNPIVYNLKEEAEDGYVSLALSAVAKTATNVKVTNASTNEVETLATHTIGHTYTLTISNLEQLEIKTGLKTADYSGVITVSIDEDKVLDRSNNGNVSTTITSGINISGGVQSGTAVEVDVVDPIWEKLSSSAYAFNPTDKTTSIATLELRGTDTYLDATDSANDYDDSTLTSDEIEVYINGTKTTALTPSIEKTDTLREIRKVYNSATTETVQYGVEYKITLTGWAQDASQVKIKILAGAIKDETGNGNKAKEFIVYNCLESSATETAETSGFLDGNGTGESGPTTGIRRNEIQQVIFVDSLAGSIASGVQKVWDVSAIGDGSIKAWTSQTSAPYTVYIGSDFEIFANQDASYLFAYIGFAGDDADGDGSIEESERYYTATATDTISNIEALNVSGVTNMYYMFRYTGFTKMTELNLGENFDTSNVTNMAGMFRNTGYEEMTSLNLGRNFDTSNVTDMNSMFAGCGYKSLQNLSLRSKFYTSKVEDMNSMFLECGYRAMTDLYLGTNFDTSNVTNMYRMFKSTGYNALASLDLSTETTSANTTQFNTEKVENMEEMFYECGRNLMSILNLGHNFDTGEVTNMKNMFYYCGYGKLGTLDLGDKFDTLQVEDMNSMFYRTGFTMMTKLDLGQSFDTRNVTDMYRMFYNTGGTLMTSLELGDLFYTSNVTTMEGMFQGCGQSLMTTLDLGPAFTKIPAQHTDFMTDCGASGLVIYAPESIYLDRTSFK